MQPPALAPGNPVRAAVPHSHKRCCALTLPAPCHARSPMNNHRRRHAAPRIREKTGGGAQPAADLASSAGRFSRRQLGRQPAIQRRWWWQRRRPLAVIALAAANPPVGPPRACCKNNLDRAGAADVGAHPGALERTACLPMPSTQTRKLLASNQGCCCSRATSRSISSCIPAAVDSAIASSAEASVSPSPTPSAAAAAGRGLQACPAMWSLDERLRLPG